MKAQALAAKTHMPGDDSPTLTEIIHRERARLFSFIRKRVPDPLDAEDILQDVFYELIQATQLMTPITHVGAWLYRVTRNRITDLFRRRKPESLDGGSGLLEDTLPSLGPQPDETYAHSLLADEIAAALEELPEEQRAVFIAHEFEGRSFKEIAEETGVSINTLLSRKHYAVRHLRRRLQEIYDKLTRPKGESK